MSFAYRELSRDKRAAVDNLLKQFGPLSTNTGIPKEVVDFCLLAIEAQYDEDAVLVEVSGHLCKPESSFKRSHVNIVVEPVNAGD